MNQLDQLKQHTTVVADTADFNELARYAPRDATTNPSLILKAVQQARYRPLFDEVIGMHRGAPLDEMVDRVLVRFGVETLMATEKLAEGIRAFAADAGKLHGLIEGASR